MLFRTESPSPSSLLSWGRTVRLCYRWARAPSGRRGSDDHRTRRDFIALLGGAAVWPLAVRAQEAGKIPRIGYVRSGSFENDPYRQWFLRGMRELGWIDGRNISFEFRNYGDDYRAAAPAMDDLLRSKVEIIVVGGTPAVLAAQAATRTIPILMVMNDPLGTGSSRRWRVRAADYRAFISIHRVDRETPGTAKGSPAEGRHSRNF